MSAVESKDERVELLRELEEGVLDGGIRGYVYCALHEGGSYEVGMAGNLSHVEQLGMLEAAKADCLDLEGWEE